MNKEKQYTTMSLSNFSNFLSTVILATLLAFNQLPIQQTLAFPLIPAMRYRGRIQTPVLPSTSLLQLASKEEAEKWLEKSKILREEIAKSEQAKQKTEPSTAASKEKYASSKATVPSNTATSPTFKWAVPELTSEQLQELEQCNNAEYRLYVDIGREPGTWMEPRWGASGRRIEFTLDVRFLQNQLASEEAAAKMVQDNKGGKKSPSFVLQTAPLARLRQGFDEMKCFDGAYRLDKSNKPGQSDTLRFYVMTKGTPENDSSYNDIYIPSGGLYFSIPCFGSVSQLSTKEDMPVTVRQMGWHTGWRRQESRIVGIFKAVPIEQARKKDRF